MERDNKDCNAENLWIKISELEHTYAELFADGGNRSALNEIWKEIQTLQRKLNSGNN